MRHLYRTLIISLTLVCISQAVTANEHTNATAGSVFRPENAIIDTSVLFAVGARQAQQELRGSYGWETFQEGLVQGIYFRFDPDGYARFSPTARLDTDLFEVICRPRTSDCIARKGPLSIELTNEGALQLSLEGIAAGDKFFIADTLNEIEVPDRLLQPLDGRFENILTLGGDLIVRRAQNDLMQVSLIGFSAVTGYLRWIKADQDYLALPRDWPVPNAPSNATGATLTVPQAWRNSTQLPMQPDLTDARTIDDFGSETASLASLQELVESMAANQNQSTTELTQAADSAPANMPSMEQHGIQYELGKAIARIERLEIEMSRLATATSHATPIGALVQNEMHLGTADTTTAEPKDTSEIIQLAEKIDHLTEEFGIDPSVAALLLRVQSENTDMGTTWSQDQIQILLNASAVSDLGSELLEAAAMLEAEPTIAMEPAVEEDFVLLTDYFRSVLDP